MHSGKFAITDMKLRDHKLISAKLNGDIIWRASDIDRGTLYADYVVTIDDIDPEASVFTNRYRLILNTGGYVSKPEIHCITKDGELLKGDAAYALKTKYVDRIKVFFEPEVTSIGFPKNMSQLIYVNSKYITSLDFSRCKYIKNLTFTGTFNMENVTSIDGISSCTSLEELSFHDIDLPKLKKIGSISWIDSNVKKLSLINVTMDSMERIESITLAADNLLEEVVFRNVSFPNLDSLNRCLRHNPCLRKIEFTSVYVPKLRTMYMMFQDDKSLEEVTLDFIDANNIVEMGDMFHGCTNLKRVDLSSITSSSVSLSYTFYLCKSIRFIDLSNIRDIYDDSQGFGMLRGAPHGIDFNYNGKNYIGWTLNEYDAGYAGTFPWNQ